jgi:hypothetical protein
LSLSLGRRTDPPPSPAGPPCSTARGRHGKGRALLMLLPEELGFLRYLKAAKVPLNEYEFPTSKLANVQSQLEKLVQKNYYLHTSAKEAYRWGPRWGGWRGKREGWRGQ